MFPATFYTSLRRTKNLVLLGVFLFFSQSLYAQKSLAQDTLKEKSKQQVTKSKPTIRKGPGNNPFVKNNTKVLNKTFNESPNIVLEFTGSGRLTSYPPEKVIPGQKLYVNVRLDRQYWISRTNSVVSSWITTLENLKKFETKNLVNYGLGEADLIEIRKEIKRKLITYLNKTRTIDEEQKNYYKNKIELLVSDDVANNKDLFLPPIDSLIEPAFSIEFQYYDKDGLRISDNGKQDNINQGILLSLKRDSTSNIFSVSSPGTIAANCSEIRYYLRTDNALSKATLKWSKNTKFPNSFLPVIGTVEKAIDGDYIKNYELLFEAAKRLKADQNDATVAGKLPVLDPLVKKQIDIANKLINRINIKDQSRQDWILKWLWLTNGVPRINPFDYQRQAVISSKVEAKVSAEEKAQYQMFESLLSKGALQINSLEEVDDRLKKLAGIKARIEAEAKVAGKEDQFVDKLLYQGILKSSPGPDYLYMRHLNSNNDYIIMNINPKKEINEKERMYILVENKNNANKLTIGYSTELITEDNSNFTNQIAAQFPAAKEQFFGEFIDESTIQGFIKNVDSLTNLVAALKFVTKAPELPVFYEYDKTPEYLTDILEHNYLYEVPTVARYSVKTPNPDNTEKEVNQGEYRINKLYRWRFKTGIIYSGFEKTDFTKEETGEYTKDSQIYGLDGTFGIQTYFVKQDIRNNEVKGRSFAYLGLSMRNITENIYFGIGLGPINGVALGINTHLGKREELETVNSITTGIKSTWGVGFGGSILIDAALFVKLFSFGSNKSLIGY